MDESIEHRRRGTHFPHFSTHVCWGSTISNWQLVDTRSLFFYSKHLRWKADCSLVNFCGFEWFLSLYVPRTMLLREPDSPPWNPKQPSFVLTYCTMILWSMANGHETMTLHDITTSRRQGWSDGGFYCPWSYDPMNWFSSFLLPY